MAGFESFTVMAIIDAQDQASRVFEKIQSTISEFTDAMGRAAEVTDAAAQAIDESLLQTASGADALSLATDRVAASEAKLTIATRDQATAEQELQAARASGVSEEDLAAAGDKLTQAQKDTTQATTELQAAQLSLQDVERALTGTNEDLAASEVAVEDAATGLPGILATIAAGAAVVGGLSVKAAADFQTLATHLVTDAGEAPDKLNMISQGMLKIAQDTGTSADEVAKGMYHIESSGFHAQDAITMMTTAAEGAKVGGADLDTVTKALAGTMLDFQAQGYNANQMMNALIETTAQGDLRMQDLASTLGNVTPIAAAAKLSFDQVGGAIATMTAQNMTAAQATQNYSHLIQSLSRPNNVQIQEMQQLGLTQQQVSDTLAGPDGMVNTLKLLTGAIADHNKNGRIYINTLTDSATASQSATVMYQTMTPALKKLSDELVNGTLNTKDYKKAVSEMDPVSAKQGSQFVTLQERMGAFNKLLANGSGDSETFNAALSELTGGQVGLRTALMLSIDSGAKFADAAKAIKAAADGGKNSVNNWTTIQGTFNQKLDTLKASLDVLAISIGTKIMPWVEKLVGALQPAINWIEHSKIAAQGLAIVFGGALLTAIVAIIAALALLMAPILLVGALVEGLIKIWDELAKWFEDHKQPFVDAWNFVVKEFDKLAKWLNDNVISWVRGKFEEFMKWWNDHSKEITFVWNAVWTEIKVAFDNAWMFIKIILDILVQVWNIAWGVIKDTVQLVWDRIKTIINIALDLIEGIVGIFLDLITGNWGKAWTDLKTMTTKLLTDIWNGIVDTFKDIGTLLLDAGKNLIKGFINGIKSAASDVTSTVKGIVSDVRSFFPFSPAKQGPLSGNGSMDVAGTKIGSMLADGMHASATKVSTASRALATAAGSGVGGLGFDGGLTAVGGGAGGGGGGMIVIDMRGSQLMSDRDMDVFADRVGRRIATRTLPAAGVRIRM